MTTFKIRPPYQYVRNNPTITTGIVNLNNAITDRQRILAGPRIETVDDNRKAEYGVFVFGQAGRETWCTFHESDGNLYVILSNFAGRSRQYNLTRSFGIREPRHPVMAQVHQDVIYIGGLGCVLKIDLHSLSCDVLRFAPGYESIVEPYITTDRLPTLGVCRHGGRFIYWFDRSFEVPLTVTPVGAQLENGDPSRLLGGARMRIWPTDILYSDPLRPGSCKWSSLWTTTGMYGGDIMACVSMSEGLLVLTTAGTWLLKGDDVAESVAICLSDWADCVAPRSVVVLRGVVLWVGRQAVWAYTTGGGIQIVDSLSDYIKEEPFADRCKIIGASLSGGKRVMFVGEKMAPMICETGVWLPSNLGYFHGGQVTICPIAKTGIGDEDEVAIGALDGIKAMLFDGSETSSVFFAVPEVTGFVREIRFLFDAIPMGVGFTVATATAMFRTDMARSLIPENATIDLNGDVAWPARYFTPQQEILVERHPIFGRERFQSSIPALQNTQVRWAGARGGMTISAPVGYSVPRGEVMGVFVSFRGCGLLGVDIDYDSRMPSETTQ